MKNNYVPLTPFFLWSAILIISSNSVFAQSIIYVKANATGAKNGTNWQNAFQDLQSALDDSKTKPNASIWVAAGTYKPTKDESGNANPSNQRTKTFLISNNVKLLGGFEGTETMECQQDFADNETILSGDIGAAKPCG
jgi:hypothetical protein